MRLVATVGCLLVCAVFLSLKLMTWFFLLPVSNSWLLVLANLKSSVYAFDVLLILMHEVLPSIYASDLRYLLNCPSPGRVLLTK